MWSEKSLTETKGAKVKVYRCACPACCVVTSLNPPLEAMPPFCMDVPLPVAKYRNGSIPSPLRRASPFASIFKLGVTLPGPSTKEPSGTWLKSTVITDGRQTVGVPVGVKVGVTLPVDVGVAVRLPVGVGVKVGVTLPVDVGVKVGVTLPVDVGVGVAVKLPVGVGVCDGVIVALDVIARLRKTTIVCEEAVPSTIVTVALPPLRFLLIKRLEGIV